MTIRTIDELRRLRRYQAADPDRAVDQTSSGPIEGGGGPLRSPSGEGQSVQSLARPPDVWQIPGPRSGAAYSQAEVAEIYGVALATVRDWVSRGRQVGGRRVRLRTLNVPRGRITPEDLERFMGAVNGNGVHHDACPPVRRGTAIHRRERGERREWQRDDD